MISIATLSYEKAGMMVVDADEIIASERTTSSSIAQQEDEAIESSDKDRHWALVPKEIIVVQGVSLPPSRQLSTSKMVTATLYRNGHGTRTVSAPFGFSLHIYIASLYTQYPIHNEHDFLEHLVAASGGLVMEFTFLRYVTPSQMSIAWNYQMDTSVTFTDYAGYEQDRANFLAMLDGFMVKGGTIALEFVGDKLHITNQGQVAGEIEGQHFQRAFGSMWFGDQPVMEEIKGGLLEGDQGSLR